MKRKWLGYTAWLLLTACLYFFENNTGTRIMLFCSLLLPLIPVLRTAFLQANELPKANTDYTLTVRTFVLNKTNDSADVRQYVPGDPIRRIHWKLSAKKDDLLIRDEAKEWENAEEKRKVVSDRECFSVKMHRKLPWISTALLLLCLAMLVFIPEANRGAQVLCNRLFAASEAVNAYAYDYFPVAADQGMALAVVLLLCAGVSLVALIICSHSGFPAMAVMAGLTAAQCYFGLAFSAWINIVLYGLLALRLMRRPYIRKNLLAFGVLIIAASLLIVLFLPGVHEPTEMLSETVRDHLSRMSQHIAGTIAEAPAGETETRHVFTQSLQTGEEAALTGREFRLVTVEEEQIAMPHWINYAKIILLLLLSSALLVLPFAPFALLNARKRKAAEAREAFHAPDVNEAVCAIFRHVILWLETMECSVGNLLYRQWADELRNRLPESYAALFSNCALDFEKAAYSRQKLSEVERQRALDLLKETETLLYRNADWKQRFLLKYWMCLSE